MDTKTIQECNEGSLSGQLTFPEVVGKLLRAGVERYRADLVRFQKLSYGLKGESYQCALELSDAPEIADVFNESSIKEAVKAIQQKKIDYPAFLRRIMKAGCTHYEVFLHGKQAIYFGRDGSHHIEKFPSKD